MGKSLQPAFFLIVWHLKKSAQASLPKAGRGWASSNARTPGGRFLLVASAGSGRSRGGADGSPPPLLPFPFGTSASEVLPRRLWSQCVALGLACPGRTEQHFQGFLAPRRGEERVAVRVCRETSGLYLGLLPLSSATPREMWGTRYRKPLAGHAGGAASGSEGLAAPRAVRGARTPPKVERGSALAAGQRQRAPLFSQRSARDYIPLSSLGLPLLIVRQTCNHLVRGA